MAELTFADLILKIFKEWRALTKPRQAELLQICNKKYLELENTHLYFIQTLLEIYELLEEFRGPFKGKNEDILKRISEIDRKRLMSRQLRIAQYEEASLYSSKLFIRRTALLTTVPDEILDSVKSMMRSFASYFQYNGTYNHELDKLLKMFEFYVRKIEKDGSIENKSIMLLDVRSSIESVRAHFERVWIQFSRDYYRARFTFADYGIYGEIGKATP